MDAARVLSLQASIGNRAVQRFLARTHGVQREGDDLTKSSGGGGTGKQTGTPGGSSGPSSTAAGGGQPSQPIGSVAASVAVDLVTGLASSVGLSPAPVAPSGGASAKAAGAAAAAGGAGPAQAKPPAQDFGRAVSVIKQYERVIATNTANAVRHRKEASSALKRAKRHWNVEAADSGLLAATEAEKTVTAAKAARDQLREKLVWYFQLGMAHGYLSQAPVKLRTAHWKELQFASKVDEDLRPMEAAAAAAERSARQALQPLRLPKSGPTGIIGMLQQKLNKPRASGPRLSITAVFTNETDAALRAFQGAAGLTVSGVADVATWTALNQKAPSHTVNDDLVVDSKEGAQATKPLGGKIHPDLKRGDRGDGVREMQQRLNNWVSPWAGPGAAPYKPFRVNGYFGSVDRKALQAFQKANGLAESGVADKATWVKLDGVAGAITSGFREFGWRETVEGVSNVGGTAKYSWEVKGDAITITVKMKFLGKKNHPMVRTWLQDIKDVWNSYKAVEVGKPNPREYKIQFNPEKSSSGYHQVTVKSPKKGESDRSNSAEWYVTDTRKGLAPHEFGHLIGLEDEYNRPEEESVAVSGHEPTVGWLQSDSGKTPKQVATELRATVLASAGKKPATRIAKIAAKVTQLGLYPGAFARAVEMEYKAAYGFSGSPNLANYFGTIAGPGFHDDLSTAAAPFVVSNQSLMGEMQSVGARGKNLNALSEHTHPVQPRHVRAFANLLSLSIPGSKWEPKRR